MKLFAKGVLWAVLAAMSLTSCGGGGSTIHGGVFIMAGTYATGSPAVYSATVFVYTDNMNGAPITDATVMVNSQPLTYDATAKYYMGTVSPDAGKFNLSVTANGATYTSTVDAFTSIPAILLPSSFIANNPNTITWTKPGGAPATSSTMFYNLEIVDTNFNRVYAGGSNTTESVLIPAGTTLGSTSYYVNLYGTHQVYPIANAATGSNFSMQAYAAQAILQTQ
ncbi:MAG: hypothetical protein KKH12_13545 [Gammaproteobacteria bacterium]|nr:hypothetical protein [Gammaproteobacteria bacterium]MBU1482682.1 hypothetical protein [Gammaproteobacteria bacterium]